MRFLAQANKPPRAIHLRAIQPGASQDLRPASVSAFWAHIDRDEVWRGADGQAGRRGVT